jgi:hypothetical protein
MTRLAPALLATLPLATLASAQTVTGKTGVNIGMNTYVCLGNLQKGASEYTIQHPDGGDLSCWFSGTNALGKRILRRCRVGGGCWVKGTFRVEADGNREVTGIVDLAKIDHVSPGVKN